MIALVIDEDQKSISEVGSLLNHEGIGILPATSYAEGVALLRKKRVDFIISEVIFSENTGMDLLSEIKQNPAWGAVPLVFFSQADDERIREVLVGAGNALFIKKPWSYERFLPAFRKCFPDKKLFIKNHQILHTITEMDEAGIIQILDDFNASLSGLCQLVESRVAKATLRAGFMDALSYAQMIGTVDLYSMLHEYLEAQGIDLVQLKQKVAEVQKQILKTKEALLGIGDDSGLGDLPEGEDGVATVDDFIVRIAKMLDEAQKGSVDHQYDLAMLYLFGSPEVRNEQEGRKWMEEAARNRHPQAIFRMALAGLLKGKLSVVAMKSTLEQMERAVRYGQNDESEFWKRCLADGIDSVKEMIEAGEGEPFSVDAHLQHAALAPEMKYAIFCLYQAAQGNVDCQFWVGKIYESGQVMAPMVPMAAYWLDQAASVGHVEAAYRLGISYQQHLTGFSREDERAFECFSMAAEKGHLYSEFYLAKMYYNGVGTEASMGRARHWYEVAAQQGHAQAQFWLGMVFEETNSTPTDLRDALKWYLISLYNGSTMASKQIPVVEKKMAPHEIEMARSAADRYIKIQESRKNAEAEKEASTGEKAPEAPDEKAV